MSDDESQIKQYTFGDDVGSVDNQGHIGSSGNQNTIGTAVGEVHGNQNSFQNYGTVNFGTKPKWVGKPFQAPPLPPNFVERSQPRRDVKKLLLETKETTPGTLVVSAIYGLGGIGKSVLATALAHDPDIHERFTDGILWVTLGQQPDILSFLATWIHALGDFDYKPTTPQAASTHLRTLLYDKRSLLVVDDAWKSEDVELFQVGGSNCRVLVTTREAPVRGAIPYYLDMMSPTEALELLNKCRPLMPMSSEEQKQALDLARALGYLPLALELAAAQTAEGVDWWELLEYFQAEVARLETLDDSGAGSASCEETRKRLSLKASFNLSLRRLSPEQLQQFAWLGVLPEDVSIGQQTAAVLWQVKPRQAGVILQTLRSKALLLSEAVQQGEKRTYRIHDLMHDRAKELLTDSVNPTQSEELPRLGLTLKEAHTAFLERYRAKTENGQWHTLSNDGYIHNYLSWHLEKAGQSQELHQLLQASTPQGRNAWYEACDRLGKLGNFVTDVARAWRLAEEMYEEKPSESIGLQCRYALIVASLNSLVGNIPAELMAALVEKQIWTPEQGLAYAQQKQDSSSRAEALGKIAPYLPETLLSQVLEATRTLQNERSRALALGNIAPHFPEILPEALEAARAIPDEYYRTLALGNIAPHFPEILPEALEAARAIQNERSRALTLGHIAPHFPEILSEAIEAARAIPDEYYRTLALGNIAPHLSDTLLPEALEAARAIQNERSRTLALGNIAPHFPEILPEALEAARAIPDEYYRALALGNIAPHLPDTLPEALEAARAIPDEYYRTLALGNIAPHFPEILPEALEAALAIPHENYRALALGNIAPHFPDTLLSQALEAARAIPDENYRALALGNIAPHLPDTLPEALEAARIPDELLRALALREIASHLPDTLSEALETAQTIQDEYYRALVLGNIASHLPDTLLSQALEAARAIQDEYSRALALRNIASHFPEILPEALKAAQAISDEYYRGLALGNIAPHLPKTLLSQALEATWTIQDEYYRTSTFNILLQNLKPSYLDFSFWKKNLDVLAYCTRKDLLTHISALSPVIIALGGKEALAATVRAIQEVGRQWK